MNKPTITTRRYLGFAGSVILIWALVVSPVRGFGGDAAVLIPYLVQIYEVIGGKVAGTLQRGFEKQTGMILEQNGKLFDKEILFKQQPSSFCETQTQVTREAGRVARANAYNGSGSYYNRIAGTGSGVDAPAQPARMVLDFNNRVEAAAKNSNGECSILNPVPVDKEGTNLNCSEEEVQLMNDLLAGVNPQPELPEEVQSDSVGAQYQAEVRSNRQRQVLARQAIESATSHQELITAYRGLLSTPSVDELNAMTAEGAASRDQLVLTQIQSRLLLEIYIEMLEQKRLTAAMLANDLEDTQHNRLSELRRSVLR